MGREESILQIMIIFTGILILATSAFAVEWRIVNTEGTGEKCSKVAGTGMPVPEGEYSIEDYAMILLAPDFAQIIMCSYGGTGEAVLESEPFTYGSKEPIEFRMYVPVVSGLQVYVGVDNKFWKQMNAPTWWNNPGEDCVKDMRLAPSPDPTSSGIPIFSTYTYPGGQWQDGKPHKLMLRVVKGDEEDCFNWVIIKDVKINGGIIADSGDDGGTVSPGGEITEQPDKNSCSDFGVAPEEFDLAYDDQMLEREFFDFLSDYSSKNNVKSSSGKYGNLLFEVDHSIFLHLGYVEDPRFITGREETLGVYLRARASQEGLLTPSEVLEESLRLNDDCLFEALLTAHNFLRTDAYKQRDEVKYLGQLRKVEEKLENAVNSLEKQAAQKQIADIKKKLKQKANIFGSLQEIRASDNVGAWYHLFGTLTASYSYPTLAKLALYWEHHKEKSVIDLPEECWDGWSADIGAKLSEHMLLRELDQFNTPLFEPSIIKRGYSI